MILVDDALTQAAMNTSLLGMVDSKQLDPVPEPPHFLTTILLASP